MNNPTATAEKEIAELVENHKIPDPHARWAFGVEHREDVQELARDLAALDWLYNNDSFGFKFGGDGDNGEQLMYLLDMLFDLRDAEDTDAGI